MDYLLLGWGGEGEGRGGRVVTLNGSSTLSHHYCDAWDGRLYCFHLDASFGNIVPNFNK